MPDEPNPCMGLEKRESVKEVDEFFLHVFVNVAITDEGFSASLMTAKRIDKVLAFDFYVKVADLPAIAPCRVVVSILEITISS